MPFHSFSRTSVYLMGVIALAILSSYALPDRLSSFAVIDGVRQEARPIPIKHKDGFGYLIGFDWPSQRFKVPEGMSLLISLKGELRKKALNLVTSEQAPDFNSLKINRSYWVNEVFDIQADPKADSVYVELRQPGERLFIAQQGFKGKLTPGHEYFMLDFDSLGVYNGRETKYIALHLQIPYGLKYWDKVYI